MLISSSQSSVRSAAACTAVCSSALAGGNACQSVDSRYVGTGVSGQRSRYGAERSRDTDTPRDRCPPRPAPRPARTQQLNNAEPR